MSKGYVKYSDENPNDGVVFDMRRSFFEQSKELTEKDPEGE